jgi:hypothetical protein
MANEVSQILKISNIFAGFWKVLERQRIQTFSGLEVNH